MSAFAMLLLIFITDFAKISLATDRVRPSRQPETWNLGPLITISAVLGGAMVAEALLLLWIGWAHFDLASDPDALCTFSFLTLLYLAACSILSARERGWFWDSRPSRAVVLAVVVETLVGTVLTSVGLPGTAAVALVAYARDLHLRHGVVPEKVRSAEK